MGKYSTPAQFAGQQKQGPVRGGQSYQPHEKKGYPPIDWSRVDVVAAIEQHTATRLRAKGKQFVGACPYPDCLVDDDGFIVWPELSKRGQHFYCRGCRRTGDLINLLGEIRGWTFLEAKKELGLLDAEEGVRARSSSFQSPARHRQAQREKREREELEALQHLYPYMQASLARYARPQSYLAERGITLEQAQRYGLGYIPSPKETGNPPHKDLWRWQGRIIFPLTSPEGEKLTFAGRTLALWESGMSPSEHKRVIEEYNAAHPERQVQRVLKTSPCGYFGFREAVRNGCKQLVIPEGEFDALSLLLAGVEGVIAMGTGFSTSLIPLSVESVILAMDTDGPGRRAAHQLALDLATVGLETRQILPSSGKDWNDMWSAGRAREIVALFAALDQQEGGGVPCPPRSEQWEYAISCASCGMNIEQMEEAHYTPTGALFCHEHYLRWLATQTRPYESDPIYADEALALAQQRREAPMSQERFQEIAQRLADAVGDCDVCLDPPGYTIEDRAREVEQELRERQQENLATKATPAEYWAWLHAKLKGFKADVPPEFLERAKQPRTYPAPFPRYDLQLQEDGRYALKQIGTWGA